MSSVLTVHNLSVSYQRKPVLWNIDWSVAEPCLHAIVGPNGSGKSTLIKTILGLVPPLLGSAQVFDQPVDRVRKRIGYVPQRESVDWDFPVSALDVVLMGTYGKLGWFRRPGRLDRDWARECLHDVGMADFADRQIGQLSGGQQQRVFLARALAQRADIYFMDEPMAGVDATTENAIFELLKRLKNQGKTVVAVHHDLRSLPKYFDRVLLMNLRVTACGPTSDVLTEANLQKTYGNRITQ